MTALDLVANRVPLPIRDAIWKRQGRLAALFEVDHPDGYVRAWSGAGSLRYGGETWRGIGDLAAIDGLGGSRKTEVRTVTVTLSAVRPEHLAFVTAQVRGRFARLSLVALRPNMRAVNGDPYRLCTGICDTQDHAIDTGPAASIKLTVLQPLREIDRAQKTAWTPDWFKSTYGEEITGADDLPGTAAREESWTKT